MFFQGGSFYARLMKYWKYDLLCCMTNCGVLLEQNMTLGENVETVRFCKIQSCWSFY